MGRSGGIVLPRLDGAPLEYGLSSEDARAITFAQTLTVLGLADPCSWQRAKRSPTAYILETLKCWLSLHGGELVAEHFAFDVTISSSPDPYRDDGPRDSLYLTVDPESAGYMMLGPAIEMLEHVHRQLPASFYFLTVGAVQRCVRVYDYRDALDRVEMLREWADAEGDQEQYEFPDVEGCIPPSLKLRLLSPGRMHQFADSLKDQTLRKLLQAAFDLNRVSRKFRRPEISEQTREALLDSNPPLPGLLVSFKPHDAVVGCFDDEAQAMMEVTPEPNLIVEIDPADHASVRQAFDTLAALCETMAAASHLAALLPGNNEQE